jgi:Phage tail protein
MSLYQASTIGTATNQISFNDTASRPYFRVQSRSPQRRNLDELDIPVPFESGIQDHETLARGYAYVIQGTMYPANEYDSDTGVQALRKLASLDISQADNLSDNGYVPYVWTEATGNKQLFLKILYVNVSDNVKQGLIKQFTLVCKIKNPTIFGADLLTATTEEADVSGASGSFTYAVVYPEAYGAYTYSVSSTITNDGDLPVYPVGINVYGPCVNPKITNSATGEYIELSGVTLTTQSNVLTIAYDKDTISVTLDGTNVLGKVTNGSTYFKLHPGGNTITLTGSSVSDGAYATIQGYSGWPLS